MLIHIPWYSVYNSGSVSVYQRHEMQSWAYQFMGTVTACDGAEQDYFGTSVAIVGDMYVVGAHLDDDIDFQTGVLN